MALHKNIGFAFPVFLRLARLMVLGSLLLAACSAPQKLDRTGAETKKPTLAITVRLGSIDLFNVARRIEKKDIERFAAVLKREQIEILSVQGISRYPNVKTRVDFVTELAAQMDMRQAYGESIDLAGRQRVNAVLSTYPIRSNQKSDFDVPSAFSESAVRVAVDVGVRDVVVVSTRLPERSTAQDLAKCMETIAGLQSGPHGSFIVTGNLPVSKKIRNADVFADLQTSLPEATAPAISSRLWYAQGELFKLLNARTVKTELGTLTVGEFGLYTLPR